MVLADDWKAHLAPVLASSDFAALQQRIEAERAAGIAVYPSAVRVFRAMNVTPLESVRVVILGQDPYHGPSQAEGLAFSVPPGKKTPPSLLNIYKELEQDIPGFVIPSHGHLLPWAEQGVLLLNSVLTVADGTANSHAKWGWEALTDAVLRKVSDEQSGVVFMLWGKAAQAKAKLIDGERHLILQAAHPSPLSAKRGFFGCRHFSQANAYLEQQGQPPIHWHLQAVDPAAQAGPAAAGADDQTQLNLL